MSINPSIETPDFRGLRNLAKPIAHTNIDVPYVEAVNLGLFSVVNNTTTITIPSELLSEAKLFFVDRPYDEANKSQLIRYLKSKVGLMNIPHEQQATVVLQCASIAIKELQKDENNAKANLGLGFVHTLTSSIRRITPTLPYNAFAGVFAFVLPLIALYVKNNLYKIRQMFITDDIIKSLTTESGFFGGFSSNHAARVEQIRKEIMPKLPHFLEFLRNLSKIDTMLLIIGSPTMFALFYYLQQQIIKFVTPKQLQSTNPTLMSIPSKYNATPDSVLALKPSVGSITKIPDSIYSPQKEKPSNTPVVMVDGYLPPRCTNSPTNHLKALCKRMLAGVEFAPAWNDMPDDDEFINELFGPIVPYQPSHFNHWVTKEFGRRDDKNRVKQLCLAKTENLVDPSKIKFKLTLHIKDEAYPGKYNDPKPRAIFTPSDNYLVEFGPLNHPVNQHLKQVWNSDNFIYYTSGADAQDLGDYYAKAQLDIEVFEEIEIDFEAFEASRTKELCEYEIRCTKKYMQVSEDYIRLQLMQIDQSGVTIDGIEWNRIGGTGSGVSNTSSSNSKTSVTAFVGIVVKKLAIKISELKLHMRMMVLGDDNYIFIDKWLSELLRKLDLKQEFKTLGLTAVIKYHSANGYRGEYCSGWFNSYTFVQDNVSYHSRYWTPKLGRVLCKTFSLKQSDKNGPATIRGMVQGMMAAPIDPLLLNFCDYMDSELVGVIPDQRSKDAATKEEHQPRLVLDKQRTQVQTSIDGMLERYDITMAHVLKLRTYFDKKVKGSWPINLSTQECPPLESIMEIDVEWADDEIDTNDIDQVHPNLSKFGSYVGCTFNNPNHWKEFRPTKLARREQVLKHPRNATSIVNKMLPKVSKDVESKIPDSGSGVYPSSNKYDTDSDTPKKKRVSNSKQRRKQRISGDDNSTAEME